jgi:hypothetical protein
MSTSNHVDPAAKRLVRDFAGPSTFRELEHWTEHAVFSLSNGAIESALLKTGCPVEYLTLEMIAAVRRALAPLIKARFAAAL